MPARVLPQHARIALAVGAQQHIGFMAGLCGDRGADLDDEAVASSIAGLGNIGGAAALKGRANAERPVLLKAQKGFFERGKPEFTSRTFGVGTAPDGVGNGKSVGRLHDQMLPTVLRRMRGWTSFWLITTVWGRKRSMMERTCGRIEGEVISTGSSPCCAARS